MPRWLAAAMCQGENARLRLPGGQERTVYPAGMPRTDAHERMLVPFLGEGTPPAD
ncbi:hypothetical protein [Streptomyces sp. SLBN-31]|uniref:hypothetical protein n=1 Tax=Streptomyces sp. SLBN-31 TaxID=2768444 RepID=UPI00135A0106|nr:hypothetical protein [Streptomyces sp. SLBN-31]